MKPQQTITVNEKEIQIVADGTEKYVAIKPICEALGVKYDTQIEKINEDEILSQLTPLRGATGADGKEYKMRVIPLRFVFGWLFTINPKNVKPEIKEDILKYRMECYNALFDAFTKRSEILKEKSKAQLEIKELEEDLKQDLRYKRIQDLKSQMKTATQRLNSMDKSVIQEQMNLFKDDEE